MNAEKFCVHILSPECWTRLTYSTVQTVNILTVRYNQFNVTLYSYSLCASNAVLLTETKYVAHNFLHHFER